MAVESEFGFHSGRRDPLPFKSRVAPRNKQRVVTLNSLALPHTPARSTPDGSGGGSSTVSEAEARLVGRSRGG